MTAMIAGLILFFAVHILTGLSSVRGPLAQRLGEWPYKGIVAVLSLAGLGLAVWGYGHAGTGGNLYAPAESLRDDARHIMPVAFILVAAAYTRSNLRRLIGHPMLAGVALWAAVHLAVNADPASATLFGGFLVYSVYALLTASLRGRKPASFEASWLHDGVAVIVGGGAFFAVWRLHEALFGVAAP